MRNRKKQPESRLEAAHVRAQGALSLFEAAALELEAVAEEARAVRGEAEVEALRQRDLVTQAHAAEAVAKAKAEKIREFVK